MAEPDFNATYQRLGIVAQVFSPSAPISRVTLFAGRDQQIMRAIEIVYRRGQHGIIFGERGVGKTSLANLIGEFVTRDDKADTPPSFLTPRVNCTASSDYDSIWREVFGKISYFETSGVTQLSIGDFASNLGEKKLDPGIVLRTLDAIATQTEFIVTIDEFDRLRDSDSKRLMADTIKGLSDHSIGATVFIVGVADTVEELIAEHQSVARAMMQIQMPRMGEDEISGIVKKGLARFNSECEDFQLAIDENVLGLIIFLSRGLPHYAHLIAQKACSVAIQAESGDITTSHVMHGILNALEEIRQSTLASFDAAIYSAHKNATYFETLTACAIAQPDRMGFFAASDVRIPLERIRKKAIQIASFSGHLEEFCDEKRGTILQRIGEARRVRYRFTDALVQPYVLMKALTEGKIDQSVLAPQQTT
jgi:Cdc6-like AAA superfamily ATPase